jgi:large subunit ribosomal protein L4
MKVPVYNQVGEQVGEEEFDAERLGPVKMKLLKQVVLAYEANRRVGAASTKTRSEVVAAGPVPSGSRRKMFRQKGTGYARMGKSRNPIRVGGGVAHGPKPRDHRQVIPKRMRRLALRSALVGKLRDREVALLEKLELAEPKTRVVAGLLERLGCLDGCLLVTPEYDAVALKSVGNLPRVTVREAREVSAYDILRFPRAVFVGEALARVMERSRGDR